MPLSFHIDNSIGFFTTTGDLDYGEGIKILHEGLQEIRSNLKNPLILFDIRKSKENRSSKEIYGIAEVIRGYFDNAKIAMLVEGDLYYGLSRMLEAYIEPSNICTRVFKNYDAALTWLKD